MPNIQNFSITLGAPKAVVLPRQIITATITGDSFPFPVIADFTGANALEYPEVIKDLTQEQRDKMILLVADFLVKAKAGLEV